LLHVVSDEIREQRFATRWERLADILAAVVGLGLAGLGAFFDLRNATSVVAVARAAVALALAAAPALLVGLAFRWGTMRLTPRAADPARAAAAGAFPLWALLGVAAAAVRVVLGALFWFFGHRLAAVRTVPARPLVEEYAVRAPPVFALFLLAAGADALAPPEFFASGAPVVISLVLAVFAQASATGAALVAAALVHRGLPASLAIPFLALGSLPLGRTTLARTAAIITAGVGAALAASAALSRTDIPDRARGVVETCFAGSRDRVPVQLASAPVQTACLAVVVLLGLAMIYRKGVRGWFLPLRHPDLRIVLPAGPAASASPEATR
jgi:hypothetical protein